MRNYKLILSLLIEEAQSTLINTEAKSLLGKRGIECTYSKRTLKQRG
jgi:hypothetical protein